MPAKPPVLMTITLDRADGTAEMRKATWSQRVPIADLPRWRDLYRRLWSSGAKDRNTPGRWARFFEADLRVLERAVADAGNEV